MTKARSRGGQSGDDQASLTVIGTSKSDADRSFDESSSRRPGRSQLISGREPRRKPSGRAICAVFAWTSDREVCRATIGGPGSAKDASRRDQRDPVRCLLKQSQTQDALARPDCYRGRCRSLGPKDVQRHRQLRSCVSQSCDPLPVQRSHAPPRGLSPPPAAGGFGGSASRPGIVGHECASPDRPSVPRSSRRGHTQPGSPSCGGDLPQEHATAREINAQPLRGRGEWQ